MSLDILFPNGKVEASLVYIWDINTLQPVVWNGSLTVGGVVIGKVDQGNPGASPWLVAGTMTVIQPTGTNLHTVVDSTPGLTNTQLRATPFLVIAL